MAKMQKNTATVVRELLESTVTGLGYDLWDVEFVKEGSDWYLRITLDSENGIDINDCETVHRAIDPILDEADPIEQSYHLEVSSPGLERVIRTPAHMEACTGWKVCAKLFTALDGSKTHTGILRGYDTQAQEVLLDVAGKAETLHIPYASISRMNAVYDFENEE